MKSVKQHKTVSVSKNVAPRRRRDNFIVSSLQLHKAALFASLLRLLRTPFTTAMAVSVMAIAIALAGSFYVLVNNAQQLVNTFQAGKQISLFLHEQISDQQASKLVQELRANKAIEKVSLITKQQALAEFQQYSGFGAALNALEANPLPAVIQVYPQESLTEAYQLKQLLEQMQNQQAVDFAQMDMNWMARLQSMMQIASRLVMLLSGLLALAVVFITGNTIRSELHERHDEVVVTKLVGGTNAFICRPFLYAGFWYGFISGMLAWCVITMMLMIIHTPIEQLSLLYQSQFTLQFMNITEAVYLLLVSSVLGVTGAYAVASHQLRLLKPE
ncbi:MAG: ABC transporter permease [Gammaproteobacteria bacterium]|nr:MAG: ABC transporter permease [Gammaproteobacteria bacterium]